MLDFISSFRFVVGLLAGIGVYAIWTYVEKLVAQRRDRIQMDKIRNSIRIGKGTTLEGDDIRKFFEGEIVITHEVYVKIPQPLDPETRGKKFAYPIDDEMRRRELGEVTGGGTMIGDYSWIDVSLIDFNEGIACLKMMLQKLRSPIGTVIKYECGELSVYPKNDG